MEYEVIGGNPAPSITDLNNKAIKTLYDLLDRLGPDEKGDPAMVTAVTDAIAKLNASLKGNDILPRRESDEERQRREEADAISKAINGQ
jgi:hypothetical protein